MIIGIDFTRSNGSQYTKSSYHHLSDERPNEYLQAISSVGKILQYYDSNKKLPVFGFGAKLPPHLNVASHCFALNGNIFSPEINGIDEVVRVYKQVLSEIVFHGPTIFNELIATVTNYATAKKVTQNSQKYYILLILTDGCINDLSLTIREIVKASAEAISIVIVGVGNEDFKDIKVLSNTPFVDKKTENAKQRDIVQFVEYSKFKHNPNLLAKEVLSEIPDQLIEFMQKNGIKPNKVNTKTSKKKNSIFFENEIEAYLNDKKKKFVHQLTSKGFNPRVVKKALENGIYCEDVDLAIELINLTMNPNKKYVKSRKHEICQNCCQKKINCFSLDCGHLIACKDCIQLYTKCEICKLNILNWKIVDQ